MLDYHWINARYPGKCSECECDISEGDRVLYYPNEGRCADIYCRPCGEDVNQPEDHEVEF
jgi:translation initiation factor IF-1